MILRSSAWALGLALAAAACNSAAGAPIEVNGIKVYERYWYEAVNSVRARAAFELACADPQLGFALIRRGRRVPLEIAVAGCGRSALYAREEFGRYVGPWQLMAMHGAGVPAPMPGMPAPQTAPAGEPAPLPPPQPAPAGQYHL